MTAIEEAKKKITDDLNWRSENLSNTARRLAFGVIGVVWGLMTMTNRGLIAADWQQDLLALAGVVALASLVADWFQALIGYRNISDSWEFVHSVGFNPQSDKPYADDRFYTVTKWSFIIKNALAPFSFLIVLAAIVPIFFR